MKMLLVVIPINLRLFSLCEYITNSYMKKPVKKTGCWFVGGDDLTGA